MKKYLILFFILAGVTIAFSQNEIKSAQQNYSSDTLNIQNLVQEQISEAREKDSVNHAQPTIKIAYAKNIITKKSHKSFEANLIFFLSGINKDAMEVIVPLVFFVSLLTLITLVRKKVKATKIERQELKKNIKLLRNESVAVLEDKKLKSLRQKIYDSPEMYMKSGEAPKVAKKLNVSMGELILAARIKSYEMKKESF